MPEDWTEEEVTIIIEDYFLMLSKEIRGAHYSKTEHRKSIIEKLNNRTHGSIEKKRQNISAVLLEFNHPFINGYKPQSNYQALLKKRVVDYLNKNDRISEVVEPDTSPIIIPSEKILDCLTKPLKNTELYDLAIESGYTPPSTANEWLEYEIESASGTDSLPWISEEMKKMMDLILIGSYFVDRKAIKVATGDSVIEKFVRLVDNVYGPIARWRLRNGNTKFFIELPIYTFANNIAKSFTPSFDSKKTKTPAQL